MRTNIVRDVESTFNVKLLPLYESARHLAVEVGYPLKLNIPYVPTTITNELDGLTNIAHEFKSELFLSPDIFLVINNQRELALSEITTLFNISGKLVDIRYKNRYYNFVLSDRYKVFK